MGSPSKLDEVLRAIAGQAEQPKYIRAYHGSPYDFDRFDASKIGTGEGAQAYGHGLYFAGEEGVSRSYRDKLSPDRDVLIGGVPSIEYLNTLRSRGKVSTSPEWMAVSALREYAPEAVGVDDLFDSAIGYWPEDTAVFLTALDDLRRKGVNLGPQPGRMYEVAIDQPEQSLLDWDATLDEQQHLLPAAERAIGRIQDPGARYDAMGIIEEPAGNKGRDLYGILKAYAPESSRVGENARFASRALMEEGIPGLRYLDGLSRRVGQGSRNYVTFPGTEDSIRILRKYAVPGAIGAGAASGMQGEQ
jgi:hypothetical protein